MNGDPARCPAPLDHTPDTVIHVAHAPRALLPFVVTLAPEDTGIRLLQFLYALNPDDACQRVASGSFVPFVATGQDDPELLDWLGREGETAVTVTWDDFRHEAESLSAEYDRRRAEQITLTPTQSGALLAGSRPGEGGSPDTAPLLALLEPGGYRVLEGQERLSHAWLTGTAIQAWLIRAGNDEAQDETPESPERDTPLEAFQAIGRGLRDIPDICPICGARPNSCDHAVNQRPMSIPKRSARHP